jgi:hypothetical protein
LALSPDLSNIAVIPANAAPLQPDLDFEAEISERVFHGTSLADEPPGPLYAIESKVVLIVPVVDSTQNYKNSSDPTTGTYKDALWQLLEPQGSPAAKHGPLTKIQRYYREQSNKQQPLDFDVFGVDSPGFYTGGPIEIANSVSSYYNGAFEPGGLETSVSLGSSPGVIRMRGNETRDITVTSAVNATNGSNANVFHFTLRFPAAVVKIALDDGHVISINTTGANWPIDYVDSAGSSQVLSLDPSALASDVSINFNDSTDQFEQEVADLREALNTMLQASPNAGDFDEIDVLWGRFPNETRGQLYIRFRFAGGGQVP